jgi:hypothetical protein
MKKCWKISILLPYVGLLILFNAAWGFAGDLGPVIDIHAITGHEINRPSQETIIEMVWSLPEGYTQGSIEGYYCLFDSMSDTEFEDFNQINTIGMELLRNQTAISQNYASVEPDDLYIFFHIAAVSLDEEDEPLISPTETIGPFRIDITAPKNVWVSGPEETTSRNVELKFGSESSNIELYISNIEYGQFGSGWIPFVISKDWVLSEGEGLKSIYVEFRDDAGNIAKAATTISYITSDPVKAIHTCGEYLPGTEITIDNTLSYTGTFNFLNYLMEIPQDWMMISTSINSDNYSILENSNIEFSWQSFSTPDNAGESMSFTCTFAVPYGQSGEKQIHSLLTYQKDENTPMNEYAQPDPLQIPQRQIFYSISSQFGNNGSVSPEALTVSHGDTVVFEINPDEGYEIDQFSVNGTISAIDENAYTIAHATENIHVNASFKRMTFDLEVIVGDHGAVQPESMTVFYNDSVTLQIMPERGYSIGTVTLNSVPIQITQNSLLLSSIQSNQILDISFDKIPENISVTHKTDQFFIPGHPMNVNLNIEFSGFLTALGFEIQLPENFKYNQIITNTGANPEIQYDSQNNMLSLAWVDLESQNISVSYQLTPPDETKQSIEFLGNLKYRFTDQNEITQAKNITSQPVLLLGTHQNISGPYTGDEEITIANTIDYTGSLSDLSMSVKLPDNWEYVRCYGSNIPDIEPQIGATGNIDFQWNSIPEKLSFYYVLKAAESTPETVFIKSTLSARYNEADISGQLMPDQVFIEQSYVTATHAASETYVAKIPYQVSNQIEYNGELTAIDYQVVIPEGWEYSQVSGSNAPDSKAYTSGIIYFSWNTIPQSPINFTYTLIPDSYTETEKSIMATVQYKRQGEMKSVSASPEKLIVTSGEIFVTHNVKSFPIGETAWYTPGQNISIEYNIQYSDKYKIEETNPYRLDAFGFRIEVPKDWTYVSYTSSKNIDIKEESEDGEHNYLLTWWPSSLPDSSDTFTFTLQVPESATGLAKIISIAVYRIGDQSHGENIETAYPNPLLIYNALKPTVTIQSPVPSPTNQDSIPLTVTFSKPIVGFQASDIDVTNASISNFSGNEYKFTFLLIPKQDGLVTVKIPENAVFDAQGKGNEPSDTFEITCDQISPTVTIDSYVPEFARTSPWLLTITFSEPVFDLELDEIYMDNATGNSLNTNNNEIFILTIAPENQGDVTISVPNNSALDAASNGNVQSNPYVRTYDTVPPSISLRGNDTINIEINEPYNDPGATAYDLIDGDITDQLEINNAVDNTSVGLYTVMYQIHDRAGNTASKERTVIVEPDIITPTVQIETVGGYLPGNDYIISVAVRFKQGITAMGYECVLPDNWSFDSVWGVPVPNVIKFDDKTQILGFAWSKDIKSLDKISFSFAVHVPVDATNHNTISANILYRYTDQAEKKINASFNIEEQSVVAKHSSGEVYLPEKPVSVDVDIHLDKVTDDFNAFSAIGLVVYIPDNWTYDGADGNGAPLSSISGIAPEIGASGILQFAWFNITDNSIIFTYDLIPPPGATDPATITAAVKYRFANGLERSVSLIPNELKFEPAMLSINHYCDPLYIPGLQQTVNTEITYNGTSETLSNMKLTVNLPDGWYLTNISGTEAPVIEGETTLRWQNIPSDPIIFSYDFKPDNQYGSVNISAQLSYERFGETFIQKANPDTISITKGTLVARQSMLLPSIAGTYFYTPGNTVQIDNKVFFTGDYQSLTYTVTKPENWSYAGSNVENQLTNQQIIFDLSDSLSNPITFYYRLSVPYTETGKQVISALVTYDGNQSTPVHPNPMVAYDNRRPEPSIQHDLGSSTAISPMNLTLLFTKPILDLERSDFSVQNATFDSLKKINDYTFQLILSPIEQGDVAISLGENKVTDHYGRGNTELTKLSIEYDSIAPDFSIASSVSDNQTTKASELPVTITFNEPIQFFSEESVSITNGSIKDGSLNGSDLKYAFIIIPDNQGEVIMSINKGIITDAAGNINQTQKSLSFVYDSISPTITLTIEPDSHSLTLTREIKLGVHIDEETDDLLEDSILITNGALSHSLTKTTQTSYEAIISPKSCGYMTIQIPAEVVSDEAGNMNLASNSIQLTFNCKRFCGQVTTKEDNKALKDVDVSLIFPENLEFKSSKSDAYGNYTIIAPAPEPITYYFTLNKTGYIFEADNNRNSFIAGQSDEFEISLPGQTMRLISGMGFDYTVSGTVLADGKPIALVQKNPVAKVYTIHPDATDSKSTVANNDGKFIIGFKNMPSQPFEIAASMGNFYTEYVFNPSGSTQNISLDMSKLTSETKIEVNVSASFGAELEVQTESGEDAAKVEIQPNSIAESSKIEMKVHKALENMKSELIEVNIKKFDNTKTDIKTFVIVQISISVDIQDIIDGKYHVLFADTYDDFESGNVYSIPKQDIMPIIHSSQRFVRFKARHFSVFGVGQQLALLDLPRLKDENAGQRRCFISTLQSVSFNPAIAFFMLTIIIGLLQRKVSRQ